MAKNRISLVGVPVDVCPPQELETEVLEILANPGTKQIIFLSIYPFHGNAAAALLRSRRRAFLSKKNRIFFVIRFITFFFGRSLTNKTYNVTIFINGEALLRGGSFMIAKNDIICFLDCDAGIYNVVMISSLH